jgi:hypothetical protein
MEEISSTQIMLLALQIVTLLVQAFLTAFNAWLGFRSAEAKADREAKAKSLHQHLERQTGKLIESIEGQKIFRP